MLGGFGPARAPHEDEQEMIQQQKESIESKANRVFDTFNPVELSAQVVNGKNYRVKIDVGSGEHIHAHIHRPVSGHPEVNSVVCGLTASDQLS
mmetsp:Transcript_40289/g.89481  ORF Transcript_40289/g.89481 Transcript_40289/m.89481 type:complete len:93 (-) Transcript_40289:113-391(-)